MTQPQDGMSPGERAAVAGVSLGKQLLDAQIDHDGSRTNALIGASNLDELRHACSYLSVCAETALRLVAQHQGESLREVADRVLASTWAERTARVNQVIAEATGADE